MWQTGIMVTPWPADVELSEEEMRRQLAAENLTPYRWSNGPHDVYGAHMHPYNKVIYVVRGSIVFRLPQLGKEFKLEAGDRLDLPQGTVHEAYVGPDGVVCLEAHA